MCKPKKSKSVLNQKGIVYETIIKALLLLSLLDPTAELACMAKQKLSFGTLSGIPMIGGCGTNLYSHHGKYWISVCRCSLHRNTAGAETRNFYSIVWIANCATCLQQHVLLWLCSRGYSLLCFYQPQCYHRQLILLSDAKSPSFVA